MSASLDTTSDWNFRILEKRWVIIKAKNEVARQVAGLEEMTDLSIVIDVPEMVSLEELVVDQEYLANLRVYTSKNIEGVGKDFVEFFKTLDVDQRMDDFIKAYLVYPGKVRFELVEIEEP